jgi:hypothetical protein
MKASIPTLALVTACAAGCASTPAPTAQVASTEMALATARDSGADGVPDAHTSYAIAQHELQQAKALMARGDNDEAADLLTRAEADAALSAALARESQQRAAADAAIQRVRAMAPAAPPSGR